MNPDELDAIEARAEACPFCTREAQAECESTGGRCSEIDAVLDDRPDLNPYEALVAGLRERGAEVEHWKEQHLAGDTPFLRDRAEKAEAAIARVRALPPREWSKADVGSAESRTARAYNSGLADAIRALDKEA